MLSARRGTNFCAGRFLCVHGRAEHRSLEGVCLRNYLASVLALDATGLSMKPADNAPVRVDLSIGCLAACGDDR